MYHIDPDLIQELKEKTGACEPQEIEEQIEEAIAVYLMDKEFDEVLDN